MINRFIAQLEKVNNAVTEFDGELWCGLLDHIDVFMNGATPESLWNPNSVKDSVSSEESVESADIFATAMKNNFLVGSVVIDAIVNGTL